MNVACSYLKMTSTWVTTIVLNYTSSVEKTWFIDKTSSVRLFLWITILQNFPSLQTQMWQHRRKQEALVCLAPKARAHWQMAAIHSLPINATADSNATAVKKLSRCKRSHLKIVKVVKPSSLSVPITVEVQCVQQRDIGNFISLKPPRPWNSSLIHVHETLELSWALKKSHYQCSLLYEFLDIHKICLWFSTYEYW